MSKKEQSWLLFNFWLAASWIIQDPIYGITAAVLALIYAIGYFLGTKK